MNQLSNGLSVPSTIKQNVSDFDLCLLGPNISSGVSKDSPSTFGNFTKLIELLLKIGNSSNKTDACLSMLLGTAECPSSSVASIINLFRRAEWFDTSTMTANENTSNFKLSMIGSPVYIMPSIDQSMDLVLTIIVLIANSLSLSSNPISSDSNDNSDVHSEKNLPGRFPPYMILSIQGFMKRFLLKWFTERLDDKEMAVCF